MPAAEGDPSPGAVRSWRRQAAAVSFLKAQHEEIKSRFQQVSSVTGDQRQAAFDDLRRLLAVHETAEEEVVHPRAKQAIAGGESIVDARLSEENEAKKVLAELEKLDVNSAEFDELFATFEEDVIAHAEAEEREEFVQLRLELDDSQLERMRNAVSGLPVATAAGGLRFPEASPLTGDRMIKALLALMLCCPHGPTLAVEPHTSAIYTAVVGGGITYESPAVNAYADLLNCTPTAADSLSEYATLTQDGVTIGQEIDSPGAGLTWCPPSRRQRITALFASPKLHRGLVRVSFTVYDNNGGAQIAHRTSIAVIPK
jgi:hemerythrin superfamily protein